VIAIIDPFPGNCSGHYGHLHRFPETLTNSKAGRLFCESDARLAYSFELRFLGSSAASFCHIFCQLGSWNGVSQLRAYRTVSHL
jgi:hypothetical protein